MKKLLAILLTISMITATGNTHAMFKNILNSFYKPQLSFVEKFLLVKKQFPMLQIPSNRIHENDIEYYNNLCKDLVIKKDKVNEDKKALNITRVFAPFSLITLPSFLAWGVTHGFVRESYKNSMKKYANLEQEMQDFLNTQKRELRLRDDIQ